LPLRNNVGKFKFLAQHLCQFFERHFDFADVSARFAAGLALAVPFILSPPDWLPDLAFPLSGSARALLAVPEVRDLDVRHRDRDGFPSLAADHLAMVDVLSEIFADLAADDLVESLFIAVNG